MIEDIEVMTVEEAKEEYPDLFDTFAQLLGLNDQGTTKAVAIATGVCSHCWSETYHCQCWNDD